MFPAFPGTNGEVTERLTRTGTWVPARLASSRRSGWAGRAAPGRGHAAAVRGVGWLCGSFLEVCGRLPPDGGSGKPFRDMVGRHKIGASRADWPEGAGMTSIAAGDGAQLGPAAENQGRRRAAGIYGAIITAAILDTAGGHVSTAALVVSVVVTLLVYWIAEEYAEVLGEQSAGGRLPSRAYIQG